MFRKYGIFCLAVLSVCVFSAPALSAMPVTVGVLLDGPGSRFADGVTVLEEEILSVTGGEFDVRFAPGGVVAGDWTAAGVRRSLDALLADDRIDIVVTAGFLGSHLACGRRDLKKPVIAPVIFDAEAQALPFDREKGASGVANLVYINTFRSLAADIRSFLEVVRFERLALLLPEYLAEGIPELRALAGRAGRETGVTVKIVPVGSSAAEALAAIPPETQAVFVGPLPLLDRAAFRELVDGLVSRRLPSFSYWGRAEVEAGILATATPDGALEHVARGVGVHVLDILRGADPGSLSVAYEQGGQLTINMATARAIGAAPSIAVLTEAELLNEAPAEGGRVLTIGRVIEEVQKSNLELASAERSVAAGEQSVREARSSLLPQLDLSAGGRLIDEDRARASLGIAPEKAWTGTAEATQLLYDESAWAVYDVEKNLQAARLEDRETVRYDAIFAAASAYLDVLRARSSERIRKNNLRLTRQNLERARIRVSVGVAGPEEQYRWESEIARSRRDVLDAEARTRQAIHRLNRVLNRPLREGFRAGEALREDPLEGMVPPRFLEYFGDDGRLDRLRDFVVNEALTASPELKSLDAAIAATRRSLTAARRAFWLPSFVLRGDVTEVFGESGAGTGGSSIPGFDEPDDTDWSLGVYATFPLYDGGRKYGTAGRLAQELARLELDRRAVADRVEERVQNAVDVLRASYSGIGLARDAARAARRNLEVVTGGYSEGIKSIIDLLDAQNLVLVADERAANAVYDFLLDLASLQRAVAGFDLFLGGEAQQAWLDRLEEAASRPSAAP